MEEENDVPVLSEATLLALQEFYKEQEAKEQDGGFEENWQLSQFWYNNETIELLVEKIFESVGLEGKIALISCPSLYKSVKKKSTGEVVLLEFDQRFAVFEDFMAYDYNKPLELPGTMQNYYDLVVADPPFLSDECISKVSQTIKYLAKCKIMLCTGAVMEDTVRQLLNLEKTSLKLEHENNLGNEFCCFTNFQIN